MKYKNMMKANVVTMEQLLVKDIRDVVAKRVNLVTNLRGGL